MFMAYQVMVGFGFPDAWQVRFVLCPSMTTTSELVLSEIMSGGTEK